jgi:Domain of unknown function (DUF5122) beta-propeller
MKFNSIGWAALHDWVGRASRVAICWCASGVAVAAGSVAIQSNGQVLGLVATSSASRAGYYLERRYPDGLRDRQFGVAGRVFFALPGQRDAAPSLQLDATGRILVSAAATADDGRSAAAVLRFLSSGQADLSWGRQGRAFAEAPNGEAVAADVLTLADGTVLAVGTVEDGADQRVAIWRFGNAGELDASFADAGVMRPFALPQSQGLSIQTDVDGSVVVAVQTRYLGRVWIEVHRWRLEDKVPLRIARQQFPDDWVGPAALTRRDGQWVWVDGTQPSAPALQLLSMTPDSPWTDNEIKPDRPLEAEVRVGHAVMNPFSETLPSTPAVTPSSDDATSWAGLVAALVVAVGGAVGLWRALAR